MAFFVATRSVDNSKASTALRRASALRCEYLSNILAETCPAIARIVPSGTPVLAGLPKAHRQAKGETEVRPNQPFAVRDILSIELAQKTGQITCQADKRRSDHPGCAPTLECVGRG